MSNEIKKLSHRAEPSSRHDVELVFRQLGLLAAASLVWLLLVYAVSLRGWRLVARYPLDGFAGLYRGGKGSIAEVWLAGKNGEQDVLLDRIFLGTGALQKRFAAGLADLSQATGLPVLESGEAT